MEKFTTLTSTAVPLKRSNIDTDQIIPANFLKRVTKTGYDDGLFHLWRQDPEFVLNQPQYEGAEILVVGSDFGIGSSREHAVWALRDYGFRVVLSPKFADIFRGNAGKSGFLAAQVEEADIERIWQIVEADPAAKVTVSLEDRTVSVGDFTASFVIDDYTRWRLMEGHDDISLTLRHEQQITDFEAKRPSWMPTTV